MTRFTFTSRDGLTKAAVGAFALAAALVYARPLRGGANYDEGVYLASARELQHGATIGGSLFTSQPPGFYWSLRALGAATSSLHTFRLVMLALAALAIVAAAYVGRSVAGRAGAVVTAAALAIAPPWPVEATRLEADAPSTALAVGALALCTTAPFAAGVVAAFAISVKLLAVAVLPPLFLLTSSRARCAGGLAFGAAVVVLSVASHLQGVWHDAVGFHLEARDVDGPSTLDNLHRVVTFTDPHTPFGLVALAAAALAVWAAARRRLGRAAHLWAFPPAAAVVLLAQHPLLDHHMVLLAAAWALPVGATIGTFLPARALVVAAAGLVVAAGLLQQWHRLVPVAPAADEDAAVRIVERETPRGGVVAADVPIVPYRAGRRQPPDLVDTSSVRVEGGELTRSDVLHRTIGLDGVVLGRALAGDARLVAQLRRRYPRALRAGAITVLLPAR